MSDEEEPTHPQAPDVGMWSDLRRHRGWLLLAAVFNIIAVVSTLGVPLVLGLTIDVLSGDDAQTLVPWYALSMVGIACVMAVSFTAARVLFLNVALEAQFDLQSRVFRHLLNLDSDFYRGHKIGDLLSRLASDTLQVRAMLGIGLYELVEFAFLFSGSVILMVRLDPTLTLFVLLPYPVLLFFVRFVNPKIYETSKRAQEQHGNLNSQMEEDLSGIAVVKSCNLGESRAKRFSDESRELVFCNKSLFHFMSVGVPLTRMLGALAVAVLFSVGGNKVIDGHITLGQLIEFHGYLLLLLWPTSILGNVISLNEEAKSSWARITEVLKSQSSIVDGSAPPMNLQQVCGEIEFRNLTIEIDGSRLVEDVSLKIEAGTSIAIVGRTGSGKSSLIATLPRLIHAPPGSIFIDGQDINTLPLENLRSFIGYASQEAFLFSTSIAKNIRHGVDRQANPPKDEEGIQAAIYEAAMAAGLERDLKALPQGLDTIVGERGISLSGGQRQRVALARCLATKPRILILDDSLSSVDAETEQLILEGLQAVMTTGTAIIISHRLTSVRSVDQIAVLDEGRLVELGVHDTLVAKQGSYFKLYETQLGGDSEHDKH